jgi:multicomponent Na+:H+ antiporter subunit F
MTTLYLIAQGVLALTLLLTLARLIVGPTISDRVVALDLLALTIVGNIAVWVLLSDDTVFLDTAIMIGLLGFIGSVAFARYIERGLVADTRAPWGREDGAASRGEGAAHGDRP